MLRGQRMGPGGTPVRSDGTCAARPRPQALTFSSVCRNWSKGMEPLSRGFRTLQSGMSSLVRFRSLPPVAWAGLGRRKTGVSSRNQPGAPGPCRPPAGPSSWEGAGPGPVLLSVPRVRVSAGSPHSTPKLEPAIHRIIISAGKDTFLLARSVFNFQSTQFSRILLHDPVGCSPPGSSLSKSLITHAGSWAWGSSARAVGPD